MNILDFLTGKTHQDPMTAVVSRHQMAVDPALVQAPDAKVVNGYAQPMQAAEANRLAMQFTRESFTHNVPTQLVSGYLTGKAVVLQVGDQLQVYKGQSITHIKAIWDNRYAGSVLVQFSDRSYLVLAYMTNFQQVADALTQMMINL